jgi:hypothetical protein
MSDVSHHITYQKEVGRIVPRLERISPSTKVVRRLFHRTLVHDAPPVQDNNSIKGFENIGCRLVNGKENASTSGSNLLQDGRQLQGTKTVETCKQ